MIAFYSVWIDARVLMLIAKPNLVSRALASLRVLAPYLGVYLWASVKIMYILMMRYVMPTASMEGLVIMYGLLIVVMRLSTSGVSISPRARVLVWGLAIISVWGLDWLIIYFTRSNLATLSI